MAIITVNVTQDCIDRGERENCERCPVALAMLHAGFVAPTVSNYSLQWHEPGVGRVDLPSPSDVCNFVHDLDDGVGPNPGPFSFSVDTDAAEQAYFPDVPIELVVEEPDAAGEGGL